MLGLLEGFKQEGVRERKRQDAPLIDIEKVANLARLSLTDEERRRLPEEMGEIIAFANQLSALDTEGVPATAHVVPIRNVFRGRYARCFLHPGGDAGKRADHRRGLPDGAEDGGIIR